MNKQIINFLLIKYDNCDREKAIAKQTDFVAATGNTIFVNVFIILSLGANKYNLFHHWIV